MCNQSVEENRWLTWFIGPVAVSPVLQRTDPHITLLLYLFLFLFLYPSCAHLEHMESVKRFVSLQFLNLIHSVWILGRGISPSQGRCLTQPQNKRTQTSMSRVGFEPTIPVFERAKTLRALQSAATVIGSLKVQDTQNAVPYTVAGYTVTHLCRNRKKSERDYWPKTQMRDMR
jgi:hypothetical protein